MNKLNCTSSCGDVVEVGCGYGTFTLPVAQAITHRLFAFDIEPELVAQTTQKAIESALRNVIATVRDVLADGTGLPDQSLSYAMLFNILHIEQPSVLLREAYRVLQPGGKGGVIHWRSDIETPRGPSAPIRPTAEQCRLWGEEVGFQFVRYEEMCCCSWHWGLVMQRPE